VDEDKFIRDTARFYGFPEEDAIAARDTLNLRPEDLVVRFNALAHFAKTYGVNILALATFIVDNGIGIEPWEPKHDFSSEDRRRIHEAEERLAGPGDWATTILALLHEIDELRGPRPPQ